MCTESHPTPDYCQLLILISIDAEHVFTDRRTAVLCQTCGFILRALGYVDVHKLCAVTALSCLWTLLCGSFASCRLVAQ